MKGKHFTYGREIDEKYVKNIKFAVVWNQNIRGLSLGKFLISIWKDVQEEFVDKLKIKKVVKGEGCGDGYRA